MERLTINQRKILAEFCANFAVAWLAAGIIGPVVAKREPSEIGFSVAISLIWGGLSLISGVLLVKETKQ